jgi:hypothetical protein
MHPACAANASEMFAKFESFSVQSVELQKVELAARRKKGDGNAGEGTLY